MWQTTNTATTATAVATALTILWSVAAAAQSTSAQGPAAEANAWYQAVRRELDAALEQMLERLGSVEIPARERAQARAQLEEHFRGIIANLNSEIEEVGRRVLAEQAEHDAREDHFCGTDLAALTLLERVGEDPADAQNALLAGFQCRTASKA